MTFLRNMAATLFVASVVWFGGGPARADTPVADPNSRAKVDCAWKGMSDSERRYMILNGGRERTNTEIVVLLPGLPPSLDMLALASSCAVASDAVISLAVGLQWRSREEGAREAIAKLGRDPAVIDRALVFLFANHRRRMGDAFSCNARTEIKPDWDRAVGSAIQRTRDRTIVRSAYALTALGVYAITGQEGAERRVHGLAAPCPA